MYKLIENILLLSLLVLCPVAVFSQTGDIRGKVFTETPKQTRVLLMETGIETPVTEEGNYEFKNIPEGSHTLIVNINDVNGSAQIVLVSAGKTTVVPDITPIAGAVDLDEFIVNSYKNKYANKKTEYVARLPLSNIENPQVYNVVSEGLMKEQVTVDAKDAVKNVPGAAVLTYPAGGFGITSRGFSTGINARNGMETTASRSSIDIGNVDRIEVLKGPSGTLFGSSVSSFGGVVNLVTKKPHETAKGSVSYTTGSYGLNRFTVDVNSPVNKDKTVLFRINSAINRQNSFLNSGHNNTVLIAPSLLMKVNTKFTIHLDAEYLNTDQTRVTYTRVTPASNISSAADIPLNYKQSLYADDANALTSATKMFVEGKYQVSKNWTSSTVFSYVAERVKHSYQYYNNWISPTQVTRNVLVYGPIFNNYTNFQQNFVGQVSTGSVKHKILIGGNYRYYNGSFNYSLVSGGKVMDTVNISSPYKALTKAQVDNHILTKGGMVPFGVSETQQASAYVTDVVQIVPRLSVLLSLRYDNYRYSGFSEVQGDGYSQDAWVPKLGIVYQILKKQLSVFGNYMSGFQNVSPFVTQPDGTITQINPIFANQSEAGMKAELFNNRLSFTASVYDILIDNATRVEPNGFTVQDGKQESKGVEFELIASPVNGFNIVLGYAFNDNHILRTTNKAFEGKRAASAPKNVANGWISYTIQSGKLRGVGIGAGGNFVDRMYFGTDNTYYYPSYVVFNSGIFYDNPKWRIDFKMNNIGEQRNWDAYGVAQPLLNVAGSLTLKF